MTSTCTCGDVTITIDTAPDFIFDCNCDLCRKSGAAWGYFTSASVQKNGLTNTYTRRDIETPRVELHACKTCAATTHFTLAAAFKASNPSADQVGVNMRLFDPRALTGVDVRYPDGKSWNGEGAFSFRRAAHIIGDGACW